MAASKLVSKDVWEETLNRLFHASDDEFETAWGTIWAPELEGTFEGVTYDSDGVKALVRRLRSTVSKDAKNPVKVHYLLRDGNTFAERHSAKAALNDGREMNCAVYVFGELNDDGLIRKFDEAVFMAGANPLKDATE